MSKHPSILSPSSSAPVNRGRRFNFDEDDSISSLQALIAILRGPQDSSCARCLGRGSYVTGGRCEHCTGSGKRQRSSD